MAFRSFVALVGSVALSGGLLTISAPSASAVTSCSVIALESDPSTLAQEAYDTNCDYVSVRTYTYLGGGRSETTFDTDLVLARAYKTSRGSYSGGAWRKRVNGVWSSWREIG
jgi:hypothetical protein